MPDAFCFLILFVVRSGIIKSLRINTPKKRTQGCVDHMTFYTALGRVDKNKDFRNTIGYEMLRQISYEAQEDRARKNHFNK